MSLRTASLAATLVITLAAAWPAQAGSPCCCAMPCAAPVAPMVVYEPYAAPQIYVVDQGPVYSGPGIFTNPTIVVPRPMRYPGFGGYEFPAHLPVYRGPAPLRVRAQGTLPRGVKRSRLAR